MQNKICSLQAQKKNWKKPKGGWQIRGGIMTEEKIKVKDLVAEINIQSKDMLRALRELGLPAKSTAGSVSQEDAGRLRDYFASRKAESVERISSQPNVIVRRRKKDAVPEPQKSVPEAVVPVQAVAPKEVAPEPGPESKPEPSAKEVEVASQPARKPAKNGEARARKPVPTVGAKVISRPGDEKAKQEVAPQPEPEKAPEPKKEEKPEPTIAQILREREAAAAREQREKEAAARAKARAEALELKKKIERGAAVISKPEPPKAVVEEVVPEKPAEQEPPRESPILAALLSASKNESDASGKAGKKSQAEKASRQQRHASADASAAPVGSSAPAFAQQAQEAREPEKTGGEEKNTVAPRVRVISRPASPAPAPRRPQGDKKAEGSFRDKRPEGQERPAAGFRSSAGKGAGFGMAFPSAGRGPAGQPLPVQNGEGREGQSKKKRLKGRRTVDFQQGDFGRHAEDDDGIRFNRGKSRRKNAKAQQQPQNTQPVKAAKRKIRVTEAIRVADMAHQLGIKVNEIIKVLFDLGVMATINQSLDIDTATLVAAEFGYEVEKAGFSEEDYLTPHEADAPESLKPRPPVVTIMGHVDHGKTSLLDAVRKSNVTSGEAGGITQHIGAYHVKTKRGEIVFLDTPGHEAFTAMRARGAQITDLVILVVAADDGVMEQTREAINHSRAANVPILVAVNKMDKPGADPDRVLRELAELGLQPEDWGGDTIVSKVSAKTREGLDDLLELVALQSEIMDLKANPDKAARGHIVEAKLDKGRGPVATVLIQEGTLHTGDNFVCGPFAGRVRALTNDQGKKVKEAGPSIPVEVQGFDGVPEAGEEFLVVADDRLARRIADSRAIKRRERDLASESRVTLETFLAQHGDLDALTLNLVLKADVQGSLEAITEALQKQSTDKVKINIVHGGTGAISESDILLASASKAIIIGFNVRPQARIKDIAEHENVDIRYYDIIYKLVDDVKSAMAGMLAPVQREVYLGQAEVRKVYMLPKIGAIAGCYVADGKIARNAGVRILREGIVVYTGKISSLKRFKDDAREVVKGNECGVGLENYNDIKTGDIIEAFETIEEAATL